MKLPYHVFVQFGAAGKNDLGLPYSIEPRKWNALLVRYEADAEVLGLDRLVTAIGYSEWPQSMNLRIHLDPVCLAQELERIRMIIPGCQLANIFEPLTQTPPLCGVPLRQVILTFRRLAA